MVLVLAGAPAASQPAASSAVSASAPVPAAADPLAALAWLAGCWQPEAGEAGSAEQWMAPAGGVMLGMARTIKAGRVVDHEFLQIRRQPDGLLAYIALPLGQRLTTFTQKSLTPAEVVFENPSHDFPQRVIYRRIDADRVLARIEGSRPGGTERGINFPLRRGPCGVP